MPKPSPTLLTLLLAVLALGSWSGTIRADDLKPKVLFDPSSGPAPAVQPTEGSEADVKTSLAPEGISVVVPSGGKSKYPGLTIKPPAPWDARGYGHVEIRVTNTGTAPLRVALRVDNAGTWQENHNNSDAAGVKPGQSATVRAIFGYNYGQPAYALNPEAITGVAVFTARTDAAQSYRIESVQAAGPTGEKPLVAATPPHVPVPKPPGGRLLGADAAAPDPRQIAPRGGAKAGPGPDGKSLQVDFNGKDATVLFKPVSGMWNLSDALEVRLRLKNTGSAPAAPGARLESKGGASAAVYAGAPIAPGVEGEIVVPFAAAVPWLAPQDPDQEKLEVKKIWNDAQPGTGTVYTSNTTLGITLLPGKEADGRENLLVTSIIADLPPPPKLPAWLGQRPPVDGEWTKTFDENFDGNTIDLHRWNIYTQGSYHSGEKTHYTRDNVIVKDGHVTFRLDKKPGHHNDDPNMPANDYAAGYADTYGKWTQRYGYFEARMKLSTAPGLTPCFWLMPDRGLGHGDQNQRAETKTGGMEYDIMETLTIFGPYRHDAGMHWDSYMKYHKSLGGFSLYFQPDREGYVTSGMLWTPGSVVMYDNGKEVLRWESPRIGSLPSYFILYNIIGGWEGDTVDDSKLPSDFTVDYVRAWQRKDLASPADGPKPNDGGPYPPK